MGAVDRATLLSDDLKLCAFSFHDMMERKEEGTADKSLCIIFNLFSFVFFLSFSFSLVLSLRNL
jgi:hypothetical protein